MTSKRTGDAGNSCAGVSRQLAMAEMFERGNPPPQECNCGCWQCADSYAQRYNAWCKRQAEFVVANIAPHEPVCNCLQQVRYSDGEWSRELEPAEPIMSPNGLVCSVCRRPWRRSQ